MDEPRPPSESGWRRAWWETGRILHRRRFLGLCLTGAGEGAAWTTMLSIGFPSHPLVQGITGFLTVVAGFLIAAVPLFVVMLFMSVTRQRNEARRDRDDAVALAEAEPPGPRLRVEELPPKKYPDPSREWILRYRVYNDGGTDSFEAKANFIVDGDEKGSSPWVTGWGRHGDQAVQIVTGDYDDLNIASVEEPASATGKWTVHGLSATGKPIGSRTDPFWRDVALSLLIRTVSGKEALRFGVRIKLDDGPHAVRDDEVLQPQASPLDQEADA